VKEQMERVRALVHQLGIGPIHITGHSMGGWIAGAYSAFHPEQVLSMCLLSPAGVTSAVPSELLVAIANGQRPLPIFARNLDEVRNLLSFVTTKPPFIPGVLLHQAAREQREHYERNNDVAQQILAGPGLDEILTTHVTRVPTLIVWGARDRAVDASGGLILQRLLPCSELRILPEVGHVPALEAPSEVLAEYLTFRRRIDGMIS
jgi:pimeloyl-ACP methyl ester carboxylesterase